MSVPDEDSVLAYADGVGPILNMEAGVQAAASNGALPQVEGPPFLTESCHGCLSGGVFYQTSATRPTQYSR